MSIRHIFLDMDGVLVDFVNPALELHEQLDAFDRWPPGEWDIPKVLGISKSQFWSKIDAVGHAYWSQMPPYQWTHQLVQLVTRIAPFSILSSPSLHPECPTGKVLWLREHLDPNFRDYLFGHQKHLCARPDVVLIDDSDTNVEKFRGHGGQAILFPQHWNSNHQVEDRLEYVTSELKRCVGA